MRRRQPSYAERLRRALPYAEFEREWVTRQPPEDQLRFSGRWLDARLLQPIIRI